MSDNGRRRLAALRVQSDSVVLDWVKLAEDGTGEVILRLYESLGRRASAHLVTGFDWASVVETDLLEEVGSAAVTERPVLDTADPAGRSIDLPLRPFQIATLRLARPPR